jgi:hypothetical protein
MTAEAAAATKIEIAIVEISFLLIIFSPPLLFVPVGRKLPAGSHLSSNQYSRQNFRQKWLKTANDLYKKT